VTVFALLVIRVELIDNELTRSSTGMAIVKKCHACRRWNEVILSTAA